MTVYPTMKLVPGDDWSEQVTLLDSGGDPIDLSTWTVVTAEVAWAGGTAIELTPDLTDAATGVIAFTATDAQTADLPIGKRSWLTLKLQSSTGLDTTFYYAHVEGVKSNQANTPSAAHPGTQGPRGYSFHAVDAVEDLTDGFGNNGDTAIITSTGAEWEKAAGSWSATGASFWGTLLTDAEAAQAAAEVAQAAAEAAQTAAETAETNAETAQAGAETARTGAETAETNAETAQAAAETARTGAETAETNAETAQAAAEAAQAAAEAARLIEYEANWYNEDESVIAEGGWPITRYAMRAITIANLFAEITHADAGETIDLEVFVDGLSVYGPTTVTYGTVLNLDALSIDVPVGAIIGVDLKDATGAPYGFWLQMSGT